MIVKAACTAASIAVLGASSLVATALPAEARDGCGLGRRYSHRQGRCVVMRDVAPNPRWQKAANRYCGPAYRFSFKRQRCVARTDWRPVVRPRPRRSGFGLVIRF